MAGGWGAPIEVPMEVPVQPPSEHLPELEGVPLLEGTKLVKPALKRLPTVGRDAGMASNKEAAAQLAADIGAAFGFSKLQKRAGKARARAASKARERMVQREGKQLAAKGRRHGRAEREGDYRTALQHARGMGIGTDIFKRARL